MAKLYFKLTTTMSSGARVNGDPVKVDAQHAPTIGSSIAKGEWPALDAMSPNFPVSVTGTEQDDDGHTIVLLCEADAPDAKDPESYRYTPWK
ncbi:MULTISPECIES: hypothetical protein [Cobetia]|uniref:Uncharacterized protein n=1 Tax=Cobetia crustatorum TaxID=553385 RepID=A0A558HED9_9GAMM|nr:MULTISPECIES: hypothetical protein [Cobetia]TVU67505.1 hypothetical protein FQP86_16685 [Cobetia crustatorum]